jgi:hypothetical protein
MFPQGPLLGGSETYQSLEIGRLHKGGTPSVSWNDGYNSGNTLDIPDSTTNPDIFIDYVKQPFSFIEISTTFLLPVKVIIQNCPPTLWLVQNSGLIPIIISPQINSKQTYPDASYDPTNDYTVSPQSHLFMTINPGIPPLENSVPNPSSLTMT